MTLSSCVRSEQETARFDPTRASRTLAGRFPPSRHATPMALSLDDVRRIAQLARIAITEDEVADVQAKLGSIFGLIDELQAIDTEGVEPMAHAEDVRLPMREDRVTEQDLHEIYQQSAPAVEAGLYLVPKVIE
jgi:aspartyl-tRNA(Asn)/glutamyl-tRNA(Gln) amidotransferase subunit C